MQYTKGPLRDAPKMGLPFDLICAVTIGVYYFGRPLVQCTQVFKKWLLFDLISAVLRKTLCPMYPKWVHRTHQPSKRN